LQGADLRRAELQGAIVSGAYIWRSRATKNSFADNVATALETAPVFKGVWLIDQLFGPPPEDEPLDEKNVAALTARWLAKIPDGDLKKAAAERLKILRPDAQTPEQDRAVLDEWRAIKNASVSVEQSRRARLDIYTSLACSLAEDEFSTDPADIAKAFAAARILRSLSGHKTAFARYLLDPACAGHGGLSDESKARLKTIVAQADKSETDSQAESSSNK